MKKTPWYPRYSQDFIGSIDCRTMSLEQFGLFNWLLDYSWNNPAKPCHLENDAEKLARLIGIPRTKYLSVFLGIQKKFQLYIDPETKEEFIYNPRLLEEYEKRFSQNDTYSERGYKGAMGRWGKHSNSDATSNASSMQQASDKQCLDDGTHTVTYRGNPLKPPEGLESFPAGFAEFWEAFPKKREKVEALKVWRQLKPSQELVQKILSAVAAARASPDWQKDKGQFIPNPAKWLRRGNWDDEIISPQTTDGPEFVY